MRESGGSRVPNTGLGRLRSTNRTRGQVGCGFPRARTASLGLTLDEEFGMTGIGLNESRTPRTGKVTVGDAECDAPVRSNTRGEANYYRSGGIMQFIRLSLPGSAA